MRTRKESRSRGRGTPASDAKVGLDELKVIALLWGEKGSVDREAATEGSDDDLAIAKQEYELLAAARETSFQGAGRRFEQFLLTISITGVAIGTAVRIDSNLRIKDALIWILAGNAGLFGLATFGRLVELRLNSIYYTRGLNRLRSWFLDKGPTLTPYFVLPITDREPDFVGYGIIFSKASVVGVMNSALAAAGVALWSAARSGDDAVDVILASGAFVVIYSTHLVYLVVRSRRKERSYERRFPPLAEKSHR